MKRIGMLLMLLLAMTMGSHRVFAQSVTITLMPGWNWISVPLMDTLDFTTALGSFTPIHGDVIKSQWGNAYYRNGQWMGNISHFYPGYGYHYKSNRTIPVMVTFNAQQPAPQVIVTTMEPTDITTNSATCGGNVASSDGNYAFVILRGICWSSNPNPTFNDNYEEVGNGIGSFIASMNELTPNTTYYVRAFAVTAMGVFYGEEMSFTTLSDSPTIPEGAINGLFSVGDNQQVYFSQGNLQYQASTDIWRFAENQWDYMGYDNASISPTYDGWIDLFGWGTSGWDNGNTYYHPWDSDGSNQSLYGPPGGQDLTGEYANADWGVYNSISNGGNQPGLWRTLTKSEWSYVLFNRSTSSGIRYARATVNGIIGVILVPDDWNSSIFPLNNTNQGGASFNSNIINSSDWVMLESNGAIFLPITGVRGGVSISEIDSNPHGYYWSTTFTTEDFACYMYFWNYGVGMNYDDDSRASGRCVRLVRSAENMTYYNINVTPNPTEGGTITGAGNYAEGQTCTLTATANNGYIFANWMENGEAVSTNPTYSFIVEGNRNLVANFIYNVNGNHAYVDLGLPSGLLWATCNVGADSPEDYGDYFAWGETQPTDTYGWSTYQYCNGDYDQLTKYCNNSSFGYNGFTDDLTILLPEDDAATANWGGDWRMPTKEEFEELCNNTTVTWTTQNGVNGLLFTASNGNSLFLPDAGARDGSSLDGSGSWGNYWSSSLYTDHPYGAWLFSFWYDYELNDGNGRFYGRSVRPVRVGSQNTAPTGAINGKFSINENGGQVYFSQGNLQYQASTDTWRFAENQYDIIGNANSNISPTYDGWIDLFGWGTSGYDNKYPWMTSEIETDYGDNQNNIAYTEYDWGQHNPISNGGNQAGLWRTLSSAEMDYMIYQRPNASNLYAMGLVNGRHGLIIFPDNFEVPNGMSFTPAYKLWSNDINNYSLNQWSMLETNGAVFLPVAGVRNGTTVSEEDEAGYYWSTDILTPEEGAQEMWFGSGYIYYNPGIGGWASRHVGYSVRLVTHAE